MICDLEAGLGTLLRLQQGQADVVVIVAQPTAKSIEVARRSVELANARAVRVLVLVLANRVRDDADLAAIIAGVVVDLADRLTGIAAAA